MPNALGAGDLPSARPPVPMPDVASRDLGLRGVRREPDRHVLDAANEG